MRLRTVIAFDIARQLSDRVNAKLRLSSKLQKRESSGDVIVDAATGALPGIAPDSDVRSVPSPISCAAPAHIAWNTIQKI